MTKEACLAVAASMAATVAIAGFQRAPQPGDLKIVVIEGEGAVNVIQRKTAVAPIVEVRDRNNLPVSGATVTFSIGSGGAQFGGGGALLTATTNAAGQATAVGLTPTAAGAVQINVTAAFQGQTITAAITQTNFATAAQAAAAGGAAGGGGGGSGAAGGAAGAGAGGGGISATTIAIIGGAIAGGAVVATQTGVFGGAAEGGIVLKGQVYANAVFGLTAATCSGVFEAIGTGSTCFLNPVSGATVSTTLDGNTTTTDTMGNFDLETTLPWDQVDSCKTYTLTIAASGHPTYAVSTSGFSGNTSGASSVSRQKFALSPMVPSFIGGC